MVEGDASDVGGMGSEDKGELEWWGRLDRLR